jgi:glycosyltransferase involved in cell wall biosynthesis
VAVSVLVPVLNEERHIGAAAAAMLAQRFDGEVEFLFIDGRSEDRTGDILAEVARRDQRVRVLDNPARHTAAALNVGLHHARGEFVARMDAHSLFPELYLARAVERLRAGGVAWVAGPQVPCGDDRWSRRVTLALESPLGTGASRRWGTPRGGSRDADDEVELDTGVFCGVMRRSRLEELGGWDEGWPLNQDAELAARVLEAGGRIVSLPELAARYVPRDSLRALARQYWGWGYYRVKTARRHPASLRRSHLLLPSVVLATGAAAVGPGPIRALGRVGVAGYALALAAAGGRALARGHGGDGAALPAALFAMHMGYGLGFLAGCARFGPPTEALAAAALPASAGPQRPRMNGSSDRRAVGRLRRERRPNARR